MFVVIAFYKFVPLPDFASLQSAYYNSCRTNDVRGTILLAHEGINGMLAGPREGIDAVLKFMRSDERLADLEHKESFCLQRHALHVLCLVTSCCLCWCWWRPP